MDQDNSYSGGLTHDRHRSLSIQGFEEVSSSVTAKTMRTELNRLVNFLPDGDRREAFKVEMDNFFMLFTRYLSEKAKGTKLDWDKISSPAPEQIIPYPKLPKCPAEKESQLLSKLAVLKLNGGLGTTMGCVGPKSAIEVRDGLTFLDLTVRQIEYLNTQSKVGVPLILMNSFNTDEETKKIVQKYMGHQVTILTFNQSRFPRIYKDSLTPCPQHPDEAVEKGNWYPPGHGDLFESLENSGLLDQLLAQGKEYIFVSNVDNLGATVDTAILNHVYESGAEFVMELTDKTKADIKGGTLIDYEGHPRLLEIAQVPAEHVDDFKSIKKFKIFNTNNLWISLKAIKRILQEREMNLDVIVNVKSTESGEKVIQLETAVGAAIKHFNNAHGLNVPRSRFLPVKSTSDLFLVTSDLYYLNHGELAMNAQRQFTTVPIVKLGDHFKKVNNFLSRFKGPPKILELDHLSVTGDVSFGSDVVLKGTVIIVANHGSRIDVPSGAILDDKVVTGNLRILEH
ncbi:UTP--glucose-1-phosphate uridylyltransferase family [Paraphysoderma sedebokerense]|nr:UTP--glucose-1-phosphate uridylyltransferase family [Paraphysoderma sedebokerense]